MALATLLTTAAYELFLNQFEPEEVTLAACYPAAGEMKARIEQTFGAIDATGRVAAECWSDYQLKLEAWHAHRAELASLLADWPAVKAHLQSLVKPPVLAARILREVGAPLRFSDLTPPPNNAEVKFAFDSAPLIRRRLTLGDLFVFLSWDSERLWQHVAGAAV